MDLHVIVAGGGIGGLALAQGLKKAGVGVAVYERDRERAERLQGYRIHINAAGSRALHSCLPAPLYDAFVATSGKPNRGLGFLTEQLRELLWVEFGGEAAEPDPIDSYKSVSRITLRQVLLAGLDDAVHFGKELTRYEETADGRVEAFFADGTSAVGDVLVGAEGTRSRVRQQLLPHAALIDTGVRGVAGKIPLTDETRALLPPRLLAGPAAIMAPGGYGMFLAAHEFRATPPAGAIGGNDAALDPGLLFDNTRDYVMWGLLARREKLGEDPEAMAPAALQALASKIVEGWHPNLRKLVRGSDPSTITLLTIRSSTPVGRWQTGRVTLLGDAIHAMPPTGGIGANTALRDAELLSRSLAAARRGERPLLEAVGEYEAEMIRYGFG